MLFSIRSIRLTFFIRQNRICPSLDIWVHGTAGSLPNQIENRFSAAPGAHNQQVLSSFTFYPPPNWQVPPSAFTVRQGKKIASPVQLLQHSHEPIRQGALQLHRRSGGRVKKLKPPGMKALSGQPGPRLFASIYRVPQQRMAE